MAWNRTESVGAEGGSFAAELALPERGRGPGILLLQEIFGVNDFVAAKAFELAGLGYVVLAPDVFWRVEPGLALPHDEAGLERAFQVAERYGEEVPQDVKVADLLRALSHLRGLDEVSGGVAAMGYCLGGSLAYFVAAAGDPDAAVCYYGSMIPSALGLADDVTCPILFHFGGADPYIPAEQVEEVRRTFAGRPGADFVVQTDAGHAFENLLAPAFANPQAAERSWRVTAEWLARHLPVG